MALHDILSWYEASLPAQERKVRGHFSTPPLLVERILDACGYTPENDLARLRVLDPACGSGNFLAGALRRLLAFADRNHLSGQKLEKLLLHNLWGFDSDPVACFLAELQLRSLLEYEEAGKRLAKNLLPLQIHQADGLAFPWQQMQNVDVLLANPPYLAAKNTDLSCYRALGSQGQVDSYLLFLDLALQIVRPGGWIGLVLPDPLLVRANATRGRERLLRETTVHHLWHLADVFKAYVGAVVIVAQKCAPPRIHQIAWRRDRWQSRARARIAVTTQESGRVAQSLFLKQPRAEMRYLLSDEQYQFVQRLHAHVTAHFASSERFVPLSQLVTIRRGEELSKDSARLMAVPPPDDQAYYPVLRGGVDVCAYAVPVGRYWIAHRDVRKPLGYYLAPKLLVVKSTGSLQAMLDLQGHVVLQTLYMLNLRVKNGLNVEDDLLFLLALLNSRLLRTYIHVLYTAYKWVQPQMEQHVLAYLPVLMTESSVKAKIIERARRLLNACRQLAGGVELKEQELYEEQERAICALYEAALKAEQGSITVLAVH
jgi:hypothetical protein